jgi:hypothetical protein
MKVRSKILVNFPLLDRDGVEAGGVGKRMPQFGQPAASLDICREHSGHAIRAMRGILTPEIGKPKR